MRARGHEVHTQVGCSGYRIDLAVVDPAAPGRYLIGVECDGASYHSAATARDRDRLRASVLRSLGWQLARIWSTDYWHDPGRELDRIEAEIEVARTAVVEPAVVKIESMSAAEVVPLGDVEGPPTAAVDESSSQATTAAPKQEDPDGPRPYECAVLERGMSDPAAVESALSVEAPIEFDRFARLLADLWEVGRVTDRLRERVRAALPEAALAENGVLWRDASQRDSFRGFRTPQGEPSERSADELPLEEVMQAMVWMLRQHHALAVDDLARETARCFGIQRLGNVVRQVMEAALSRLITDGECELEGATVRLPS